MICWKDLPVGTVFIDSCGCTFRVTKQDPHGVSLGLFTAMTHIEVFSHSLSCGNSEEVAAVASRCVFEGTIDYLVTELAK